MDACGDGVWPGPQLSRPCLLSCLVVDTTVGWALSWLPDQCQQVASPWSLGLGRCWFPPSMVAGFRGGAHGISCPGVTNGVSTVLHITRRPSQVSCTQLMRGTPQLLCMVGASGRPVLHHGTPGPCLALCPVPECRQCFLVKYRSKFCYAHYPWRGLLSSSC